MVDITYEGSEKGEEQQGYKYFADSKKYCENSPFSWQNKMRKSEELEQVRVNGQHSTK